MSLVRRAPTSGRSSPPTRESPRTGTGGRSRSRTPSRPPTDQLSFNPTQFSSRQKRLEGKTYGIGTYGIGTYDRLAHLGVPPEQLARSVPTGTIGDPDDFGAVAAFLCSEQARYLTGAAIPVDGDICIGLQ